jgi:hypothetical protein
MQVEASAARAHQQTDRIYFPLEEAVTTAEMLTAIAIRTRYI